MAGDTHVDEIEAQAAMYALGALPPAEAEAFEKRLASECPLCVSAVDECSRALSMLALSVPQVEPPAGLRTRLLESIQPASVPEPPVDEMVLVRAGEGSWKPAPFPGVEMRFLYKRKTMLVRMTAASRIPAHPHATAEQCLVLEGSVTSNGVTAYAGDFVYMPAGSAHDDLQSPSGALLLISYA